MTGALTTGAAVIDFHVRVAHKRYPVRYRFTIILSTSRGRSDSRQGLTSLRICREERPMSSIVTTLIEIRTFHAKVNILKHALQAKQRLGLYTFRELEMLKDMRYEGPTVVSKVQIIGQLEHPMSDDGSCEGSYEKTVTFTVPIAPQGLEAAKKVVSWDFLMDAWWADDDEDEDDILSRRLDRVVLLDNVGHVVAEATVDVSPIENRVPFRWIEPSVDTLAKTPELLAEALRLESEAQEEARWDNFCTAKSLRAEAAALRRRVDIAEFSSRVTP